MLPHNVSCSSWWLAKFWTFAIQPVFRKYKWCLANSFSLEKTATIKWKLTEEEGERRADGEDLMWLQEIILFVLSWCLLVRPQQKCLIFQCINNDASTCDTRIVWHNRRQRIRNVQLTVVDRHVLEFARVCMMHILNWRLSLLKWCQPQCVIHKVQKFLF